jgi:hypothetical protein
MMDLSTVGCCVQGVGGISDIITTTGDMNVDFADIKAVRTCLLKCTHGPLAAQLVQTQ